MTKKRKTAAKHWSLSWAKVGRSYVARVGGLTVSVVERGPKGPTKRWLVDSVFGTWVPSEVHYDLESALREAEDIARTVVKRFVSDPDVIGLVSR